MKLFTSYNHPDVLKGLTKSSFRASIKAILSRYARKVRLEGYLRLKNQLDVNNDPMVPLGKFWTAYKADRGLMSEIGRATGAMLEAVGDFSANSVYVTSTGIEVSMPVCKPPLLAFRARMFQEGFSREVKSEAEEKKLKSMSWATEGNFYTPLGKGRFAVGSPLSCPPRPFWGIGSDNVKWMGEEISNLLRTGRGRI